MKKVPTNLDEFKTKVDKLRLVFVPVDLHKLSDEVKNDVVKKDLHDVKIKKY